jgi:alkaline phosphatase D
MFRKTILNFIFLLYITNVVSSQSKVITTKVPETIAFGSCNYQYHKQDYWKEVIKNKPDIWIWLGDNIYANTQDTAILRAKYRQQMANPNYVEFKKQIPIEGTWDDHDMGCNGADKCYIHRKIAKDLFWDLMDEPKNSPIRNQNGVYRSVVLGPPGKDIKIILMDLRYLKDKPGIDSTMLGKEQWEWLEKELLESKARINILGSGIQFLSEKLLCEGWKDYPTDREKLWKLLEKQGKYNTIVISGDIHSAELLRGKYPNNKERDLFEFTSSGLTHSNWWFPIEENKYTAETDFFGKNFGIMRFTFEPELTIRFEIKNLKNKTVREVMIKADEKGRLTNVK